MRLLAFLLLLSFPAFAQQPTLILNGTWLRTDMLIDGKPQVIAGQEQKRTFTESTIALTMRDSATNSSRQWHEVYRFLNDSCFIAVRGYEYSATWVSSNFRPEFTYCVKLLTDSQLVLSTSEGGAPIELRYRKIPEEYIKDIESGTSGNSNPEDIFLNRKPLVLQNTSDTSRFYTIDPWQEAEISFVYRSGSDYAYIDFTGNIYRATDSTVYICFSSKRYYNYDTDDSWDYSTSRDTVEEFPIRNLVSIKHNTQKREAWMVTGGFFMVMGSIATLVVAPLVGIRFRQDFEIDEKRYYNVAVPGLGAFFSGMVMAIAAHSKTYYLQRKSHDIDKYLWKPVK